MLGDGLPEVVDVVGLAGGPDVVVDFADQPGALFVFDQGLHGRFCFYGKSGEVVNGISEGVAAF